MIHFEGL